MPGSPRGCVTLSAHQNHERRRLPSGGVAPGSAYWRFGHRRLVEGWLYGSADVLRESAWRTALTMVMPGVCPAVQPRESRSQVPLFNAGLVAAPAECGLTSPLVPSVGYLFSPTCGAVAVAQRNRPGSAKTRRATVTPRCPFERAHNTLSPRARPPLVDWVTGGVGSGSSAGVRQQECWNRHFMAGSA